jgi:hypothetical protein
MIVKILHGLANIRKILFLVVALLKVVKKIVKLIGSLFRKKPEPEKPDKK